MLIDRKESSIKISGVLGYEARGLLLKWILDFNAFVNSDTLTQNAVPDRINAGSLFKKKNI